jgi:hypothetical protein
MAAPEQISEQHQLEDLPSDPEWAKQYSKQRHIDPQVSRMSFSEWVRQQRERYASLSETSQLEDQAIDPEWKRQYIEQKRINPQVARMSFSEWMSRQDEELKEGEEKAESKEQQRKTGELLGINLSRVPEGTWSSFSAKLLLERDKDREEGKHSYIILLDILKGGGANHVSDDERKSKEYEDMKELVVKECKKQLGRYIR